MSLKKRQELFHAKVAVLITDFERIKNKLFDLRTDAQHLRDEFTTIANEGSDEDDDIAPTIESKNDRDVQEYEEIVATVSSAISELHHTIDSLKTI